MTVVPSRWEGEADAGEVWSVDIEHDLMREDRSFAVTIVSRSEDVDGERAETFVEATPGVAREMATALLVYAHLAEQNEARRVRR
jgi:hypothetical protein